MRAWRPIHLPQLNLAVLVRTLDLDSAVTLAREVLHIPWLARSATWIAMTVFVAADLGCAEGHSREAAKLLGFCCRVLERTRLVASPSARADFERLHATLAAELEEDLLAAEIAAGEGLSVSAALSAADALLTAVATPGDLPRQFP